ncbi:Protein SYS1 [Lachnellula arida]|uniref:Protein SYS1 n=1 Tax=Lachnellula arida TaxID=1316785 RepID=A0A8T9BIC1_9HELO|nr:Protein SYS1 [Lachnellula arida]
MARRAVPPRPGALTELPPLKILSQIALLQTIWYSAATALILFTVLVAGKSFSIDLVLSWRSLRGDTTVGWMLGLVWLLNSLFGVISILFFVARSKLVPDFALTLHFIHLVVTSLYSHSIPTNWLWWVLQVASAGMMTSLGIWSCQWRELRPIHFGGSSTAQVTENTTTEASEGGDEEQGHGRGRGRGRGRDGAGEYEMVSIKPEAEAG